MKIPFLPQKLGTLFLALHLSGSALGAATSLPPDANVLNVKNFGAKGDGVADDTAAIVSAVRAFDSQTPGNTRYSHPQFIYFPPGTYKISSTITNDNGAGWYTGSIQLWGSGENDTTIKLANNASGFADPINPAAMFKWTGEHGNGNEAFRFGVANLTVDIGSGNPGAVGLQFSSCNEGFIENVTVRSSDPGKKGAKGIWVWQEPDCMLKNITVDGFNYGVHLGAGLNGVTVEDVTVTNQLVCGVLNDNTSVIRHLISNNSVSAFQGKGDTTILDSTLTGGASANTAIASTASALFLRNIAINGYGTTVSAKDGTKKTGNITEFAFPTPTSPFNAGTASLNLPIEETPLYWNSDLTQWYNVNNAPGSSFTEKLQWAIDNSGKPVIYIPWSASSPSLTADIHLRGSTTRQIVGMHSSFGGTFKIICDGTGVYNVEHLTSNEYILAGSGTLVLRHTQGNITVQAGANGKLFVDDALTKLRINGAARCWVRRINTEYTTPEVLNQGGVLWLLGAKFEGKNEGVRTTSGGSTETFGIHSYDMTVGSTEPLYNSTDSVVSYIGGSNFGFAGNYRITMVSETEAGVTKTMGGNHISLYRGQGSYTAPAGTAFLFETEALQVVAKSAATLRTLVDSNFSGGSGTILDATQVGDYVTYLLPNISARTYDVRVGVKKYSSRGICQLFASSFAGGANIGSPFDQYSASTVYSEFDLGNWSPSTTSDQAFKFIINGKNPSSSGYSECFDYIKLIAQ